jgi:cell wall assembly regulator SMI1
MRIQVIAVIILYNVLSFTTLGHKNAQIKNWIRKNPINVNPLRYTVCVHESVGVVEIELALTLLPKTKQLFTEHDWNINCPIVKEFKL